MSEREPEDILNNFLNAIIDDLYNFDDEDNYKVSSCCLQVDFLL